MAGHSLIVTKSSPIAWGIFTKISFFFNDWVLNFECERDTPVVTEIITLRNCHLFLSIALNNILFIIRSPARKDAAERDYTPGAASYGGHARPSPAGGHDGVGDPLHPYGRCRYSLRYGMAPWSLPRVKIYIYLSQKRLMMNLPSPISNHQSPPWLRLWSTNLSWKALSPRWHISCLSTWARISLELKTRSFMIIGSFICSQATQIHHAWGNLWSRFCWHHWCQSLPSR